MVGGLFELSNVFISVRPGDSDRRDGMKALHTVNLSRGGGEHYAKQNLQCVMMMMKMMMQLQHAVCTV